MKISILLCHFKTGKMTAFAISQLLKYKGEHELEILVCDNNFGDGSIEYLNPFIEHIKIFDYPKDKVQSHGCGYDYLMPHVTNEVFLTIESDSYPTKNGWIDNYKSLIDKGFHSGGSLLKLSGGIFLHPCGSFYLKSIYQEAKQYCDNIQYDYFPNMGIKENFQCHIMIRKDKVDRILQEPEDYMELAQPYKKLTKTEIIAKRDYYKPIAEGVFHNGMGKFQESIKTFGERNTNTGIEDVLFDNKEPIIYRIGYEPGQYFCYWQKAMGKNIALIPTEIKWMRNRGGQQQEYTLMDNGFKHLWGVSAYHKANIEGFEDVISFKENQVEQLYNSLPQNQKINI